MNRGLSGYNSRWARIILPRLLHSQNSADNNIVAVTVFFGANDCALEGKLQYTYTETVEYWPILEALAMQYSRMTCAQYPLKDFWFKCWRSGVNLKCTYMKM